ncbi:MAG: hypothetical protein JW791_00945 [Nanoarchaeota archaeon]|nr:hypothetical protein [Nanoarchaeota archaeon]
MRKADIEIEQVIGFILVIVAILLIVLLISGLFANAEQTGGFIEDLIGEFF